MRKQISGEARDGFSNADRLAEVESALERLERKVAAMEIENNSGKRRLNAIVDFYEHRIDQIYRQVVNELGRTLGSGGIVADSEADVDLQLARIFSSAIKAPAEIVSTKLAAALTDEITPGRISSPLTLSGFRLDRSKCRETTAGIEILPKHEGGGGIAVFGPYRRLKPGSYRLSANIKISKAGLVRSLLRPGRIELDVYSAKLDRILGSIKLSPVRLVMGTSLSVEFNWSSEAAKGPVEFRLHQRSNSTLNLVDFDLSLADR